MQVFFYELVSGQPLITSDSDLDHRYIGGFNCVGWHHFVGVAGGARGQTFVRFKHKYNLKDF